MAVGKSGNNSLLATSSFVDVVVPPPNRFVPLDTVGFRKWGAIHRPPPPLLLLLPAAVLAVVAFFLAASASFCAAAAAACRSIPNRAAASCARVSSTRNFSAMAVSS